MKTRRSSARMGFTLIELLTVIAIIGILAAILIPTVGRVRTAAHSATNRSNVRTLVMANLAYETDNKYFAPNHHNWDRDPYRAWPERVAVYAGFRDWDPTDADGPFTAGQVPPGVYRIPQSPWIYTGDNTKPLTQYERNPGFYGSEDLVVNQKKAIKQYSRLRSPGVVWMITDNTNETDAGVRLTSGINDTATRPGRLGSGYMYGMADASVKFFKAGEIPADTPTSIFHNVMINP